MLIPKKKIIVFGEDLKLGINLIKTIIIELIRSWSRSFSLQGESVCHVNICVLVCDWYLGDWLKLFVEFLNSHKARLWSQQVVSRLPLSQHIHDRFDSTSTIEIHKISWFFQATILNSYFLLKVPSSRNVKNGYKTEFKFNHKNPQHPSLNLSHLLYNLSS